MSKNSDARVKLDRLGEALARELDTLSDDELFEEMGTDGDVEKAVTHVKNLVESAVVEAGRQRLARARQAYDAVGEKHRSKVIQLPLNRKKALGAQLARSAEKPPERLTLAARNEDNPEADVDSLLEDLLILGVIDDEGNPR